MYTRKKPFVTSVIRERTANYLPYSTIETNFHQTLVARQLNLFICHLSLDVSVGNAALERSVGRKTLFVSIATPARPDSNVIITSIDAALPV